MKDFQETFGGMLERRERQIPVFGQAIKYNFSVTLVVVPTVPGVPGRHKP
jgi:hypothetical protein